MKQYSSWLRHPLALPIYIPTLLIAIGGGMISPIMPLYAASFDASYTWIGIALAARGLGTIIGDVPAGLFIRTLGQRRLMLTGLACIALCALATSQARTLWQLILFGLIEGMGGAFWNISRHAFLTDHAPVNQRGRAIATFGGIFRTGGLIGQAVGGFIAAGLGMRVAFVCYAIMVVITAIFPALYGKDENATNKQNGQNGKLNPHGAGGGHGAHLWTVIRENYQVLMTAGVGQLFAQMIRSGRNIVVPLYGANILGLDVQSVGLVMSISSAIDAFMFFPAGYTMDRFGRKYAYVSCFFLQGIGMALIPLTGGFYTLLAATSLIGFGNGLGSGTMMTLGADLAPKESMGEFLGLWRLIGDSGMLGAPLVVGTIADALSLSPAIFTIAAIGLLAAFILGFFVPETLRVNPEPVKS